MRKISLFVVLALASCVSVGEVWTPEGPHPRVVAAGAIHAGPGECLHSSVSNADPVTDLTTCTLNVGPSFKNVKFTLGAGWQFSRMWGACDSTGQNCEKTWINGLTGVVGVTYFALPFRADLRGFMFDDSPVGARSRFPLGVEALVLLFGVDF